jgi:hypothetical protein
MFWRHEARCILSGQIFSGPNDQVILVNARTSLFLRTTDLAAELPLMSVLPGQMELGSEHIGARKKCLAHLDFCDAAFDTKGGLRTYAALVKNSIDRSKPFVPTRQSINVRPVKSVASERNG